MVQAAGADVLLSVENAHLLPLGPVLREAARVLADGGLVAVADLFPVASARVAELRRTAAEQGPSAAQSF